MWSLDLDRLGPLPSGLAIETGTARGNGARALAKRFRRVITIELSEELHRAARERLRELSHVECLHGNSAQVLSSLLPTLPVGEAPFFFLDAHWSGDRTVRWREDGWQGYGLDTAHLGESARPSGPEQCPLAEELTAIMRYCRAPAAVLVDDLKNLPAEGSGLRDGTFPGEDWSHLSRARLLDIVAPRLVSAVELRDPSQWFLTLTAI